MFTRDTFHSCAQKLSTESAQFRTAYEENEAGDATAMTRMQNSSLEGYSTLRAIALSVRPEADYGLIPDDRQVVGKLIKNADPSDVAALISNPDSAPIDQSRFEPLTLRDSLNKIAHANPGSGKSGFSLTEDDHRIILSGEWNGSFWVSIASLYLIIEVLNNLPDGNTQQGHG